MNATKKHILRCTTLSAIRQVFRVAKLGDSQHSRFQSPVMG